MGFIVFEEEAFNYLDAQLENFVKRMDRIRERSEDKTMNKWLDTQDVCQTLNICPRTVQTLRDNGTLAYSKRVRDAAFFLIIMLVTFAATLLNPQKYVSSRTIQKCVEHVSTST